MKGIIKFLAYIIGILFTTAILLFIGIGIGGEIILFYVIFTIICIVRLLL